MKVSKRRADSRRSGISECVFALAVSVMLFALAARAEAAPGDLDPTFGTGGRVTTDLGGFDTASALAIQADGKIVVTGSTGGGADFALARYNEDGSLDPSFGIGGKVTTDLFGEIDSASVLALQPDGKIVVAGSTRRKAVGFGLARYNEDGSLDRRFGKRGKVFTKFSARGAGGKGASAYALAMQIHGKIVLAGDTGACTSGNPLGNCTADFALARYKTSGRLDRRFGKRGKVITVFGSRGLAFDTRAYGVAIQPDNKIVVVGSGPELWLGRLQGFALARYKANGRLDRSFGERGKVTTDFGPGSAASALAIQPDGKIVVAGTTATNGVVDFALARYLVK